MGRRRMGLCCRSMKCEISARAISNLSDVTDFAIVVGNFGFPTAFIYC